MRYVMASRRAGRSSRDERLEARTATVIGFELFEPNADLVGRLEPDDDTAREVIVFEADEAEVAQRRSDLGLDVILEPEMLHWPAVAPLDMTDLALAGPMAPMRVDVVPAGAAAPPAPDATVQIVGADDETPLEHVTVTFFLYGPRGERQAPEVLTDATGRAAVALPPTWTFGGVVAVPVGGYWPVSGAVPSGAVVALPPIDARGPLWWWHEVMGITSWDPSRGAGITVGVADTGVGQHPDLAHVTDIGAFLDGSHDPTQGAGADSRNHGSHVSGTIAGRPADPTTRPGGIAPGANLCSARIFGASGGANQGDIANAVDALSRDHDADIVNLSLGSPFDPRFPQGSEIEHDAIVEALERGTLVVCAAGNEGAEVGFPARFAEAIAVAALGRDGEAPAGTVSAARGPSDPSYRGRDGLFIARFSNVGAANDLAGPGVGIVATVPERHGHSAPYLPMDGTSMATPAVCGALAVALAADATYRALPRDQTRSDRARAVLNTMCQDIGLPPNTAGRGLPVV